MEGKNRISVLDIYHRCLLETVSRELVHESGIQERGSARGVPLGLLSERLYLSQGAG